MPKQTRYNLLNYNAARYNGGPLSLTFSTDLFVFEEFSLHNGTNIHLHSLDDSGPSRLMVGGKIPRGDGEYLNSEYWVKKVIEVEGTLSETTSTLLESSMDTIRKSLRKAEGNLDITRNSVVRRYKASLVNMDSLFEKRAHYNNTWIRFNAKFECRLPFAEDRGYTALSESITIADSNITDAENLGTIEAQPVITVIVDAASSFTVLNIKRIDGDGDTLDEIEHSGTIAAGDVLVFDSEAKTVKKNGTEVDYTGAFPVLDVGGNILKFTSTSTSHDFYVTVKWKNRYL